MQAPGDVILCDVARREVSVVVVDDLRELRVPEEGTITMETIDTELSTAADFAEDAADKLAFGDAVVWEDVEARTSEETQLSINFVAFMMIAALGDRARRRIPDRDRGHVRLLAGLSPHGPGVRGIGLKE